MPEVFNTSPEFARNADAADVLARFKTAFYYPQHDGRDVIYFCGNSLGLQPRNAEAAVLTEMNTWRTLAIDGFFEGKNPWLYYQEYVKGSLARLVGCKETEVTVMNTLTVNLHLLMLSFYHPDKEKFTILMEAGAFPSDQYAVETLVRHFGLDPAQCIIELKPEEGEKTLRTEAILEAIEQHRDTLAMVMMGGINYYTGQLFDMQRITTAAHEVGAIAGFDLAHVVGNIPLQLHNWGVDFAVWCSYKYLNGGPGAVGGLYIHEYYATDIRTPRLGGWWGNEESIRFKMEKGFIPKSNAGGWNISTVQILNTVCLKASLEIFDEAGIERLREKSIRLTAYLEYLLYQLPHLKFEIITPSDPTARGAQLSLYFSEKGKEIHSKMNENGIVVDYREPGVIRVAPAPLYCSYSDVYRFYGILRDHF